MSSQQSFAASSPISPSTSHHRRTKSRFTYKNLTHLAASAPTCPLRCIAHIDLDAFYAQCEMVRLNTTPDQPLAVQQWQGLIAINYAARAYGLSRHVTIAEAQKACPQIICQHVATWREGDARWAYHEDAFQNMGTHKVSLDPYRLQSRRILATIRETLPAAPVQRVEKASVDEVFLDLSAQIHALLLERYPELRGPPPYDDPTECLPAPPTSALDWNADALVDLDEGQAEEDTPDWDDVVMLLGSEIVRGVRAQILEKLGYTCSAGVARNKMLSKLGSGYKKPNQQTIVRNRAVQHFVNGFKVTKIRNLGGKLGDEVVGMFNTDNISELLKVPLEQMKKLGDDTGMWLHQTIRGEDHSEVNSRTQIKSMLSAKSFRPSINTFEQAVRWLRIFVADIFLRLVEEGVLENRRRPKTINLHHRQGAQTRSKQAPIPQGRPIDENGLFDLAKNLLAQVIVDGRAWPCANLSLSVGGFEDGITGNKGIGGFLVKGDEAKMLRSNSAPGVGNETEAHEEEPARPEKRRRVEDRGINTFFVRQDTNHGDEMEPADFDEVPSAQQDRPTAAEDDLYSAPALPPMIKSTSTDHTQRAPESSSPVPGHNRKAEPNTSEASSPHQTFIEKFLCDRCQQSLPLEQKEEHNDWHFARSLQNEEHAVEASTSSKPIAPRPPVSSKPFKASRGRGRPPAGESLGGSAKGQSKLAFGK